jgi:hypothetical protein
MYFGWAKPQNSGQDNFGELIVWVGISIRVRLCYYLGIICILQKERK